MTVDQVVQGNLLPFFDSIDRMKELYSKLRAKSLDVFMIRGTWIDDFLIALPDRQRELSERTGVITLDADDYLHIATSFEHGEEWVKKLSGSDAYVGRYDAHYPRPSEEHLKQLLDGQIPRVHAYHNA